MKKILPDSAAWAVVLFTGCAASTTSPDTHIVEATARQAEQSRIVAESGERLAEASQSFVEGESAARREVIGLQRDLRSDQAELNKRRDALESERQQLDARRQRVIATERQESVWSALVSTGGLIVACLAPLTLAGAALWGLWRDVGDHEAAELVLTEIMQTSRVTDPIAENSDGDPASLAGPRETPPPALPLST